ncbi:MAG: metallophosphoesterase family protein [Armatimonadota bacterium]|nr:metallophosphoesterase family protein [Armatimonadota bacterium]MDR7447764.1 metallophosphoesterase family protein [Armatimonadota bacterium]MDR7458542.1 metallophosphoesterase family protein [Armatimonadota bacterium]MDR7479902.1 metallophosphoesterase family protein [Armatimonadota bacterium]MDR7487750.1 metallophosphoesterase family protein [Armatimonadota bacterium]
MRIAILSDVHANLEALEATLGDARRRGCERIVCLGDFVGYGPSPNECVDRLRPLVDGRAVAGNHDWAAVGKVDITYFNPYAQEAIRWTQQALRPGVRDYLTALPHEWVADGTVPFLAVHGSPRDPIQEYVLDQATAEENFRERSFAVAFVGHTHVPALFLARGETVGAAPFPVDTPVVLQPGVRYLINVGSVGQPRDGDPRAAYVLLDSEGPAVILIRVEYPIEVTQERMRAVGLPEVLAERLRYGR